MSLRTQINDALKVAMLAKEERTVGALRLINAKLKDQDIAARPKGVTDGIKDDEIMSMMQGMIKQRRESIAMFEKEIAPNWPSRESDEIEVIERFCPNR